ncbi:MAG: right-handed parallel beta-helix repeat-containing protein [Saprospiraceae bacterium]
MKHLILAFALFQFSPLRAKIWQVGPTRNYTVPSAVSNLVADGDTVEIDAGIYIGDVAKWHANYLRIRSVGVGYAHLEAAGNHAEGKAIWVIKGAFCTVEGIEFSGCQVPDHNGAGIRQEGMNLNLRHCYFHHNEMGILTSNDGASNFLFESCEFSHNGYGDGFSHNVYVGAVGSLTMRYCYSHDAHIGHLVKSRAKLNVLQYNRFTGENGDGSYEVDLPNGGEAYLIGNLIEQSPNSQNGGIISFGLENQNNPQQFIILSHNTVVNDRFDGRFVQFSNATSHVVMDNNLFLGPGTLLQGTAAMLDSSHNIRLTNIADAMLVDPANYDYHLLANSPCVDAGFAAGILYDFQMTPNRAYLHPLAHSTRSILGAYEDVGAYEFEPTSLVEEAFSEKEQCRISPNPLCVGEALNIQMAEPLAAERVACLFDVTGRVVQKQGLLQGQNVFQMPLPPLPPGVYFLQVSGLGIGKVLVVN